MDHKVQCIKYEILVSDHFAVQPREWTIDERHKVPRHKYRTSYACVLYVYTVLAMLLFKLKLVNWLKRIESALHFGKALTSIKLKHYETIKTMRIENWYVM